VAKPLIPPILWISNNNYTNQFTELADWIVVV